VYGHGDGRVEFRVLLVSAIDDKEAESTDAITGDGPKSFGPLVILPFNFQAAEREQASFVYRCVVDQQPLERRIDFDQSVCIVTIVTSRMILTRNESVIDPAFDELVRRCAG
jgi:hypothetical protein